MLNKQGKGKIDWCDYTWNPVSGCLHGCEYCYIEIKLNTKNFYDWEELQNFKEVLERLNVEFSLEASIQKKGKNQAIEKITARIGFFQVDLKDKIKKLKRYANIR